MNFFASIREYIDSLVHPSAQQDALTAARHRAFIAPRLLGSLAALAAFPVYVTVRGVPSLLEVVVFAWLVAPILIAYFLSRTGQYESAHVLSSLALTGLVTAVAAETGGINSFAAIWLVVVPLEASLSASRRVVGLASAFAIGGAGLLLMMGVFDLLAPPIEHQQAALAGLGIISAALYAAGLALGAESLARTSFWLRHAEEDRYCLLARNMTDVITRHGPSGVVVFISPAAEPLFGVPARELIGHGLLDRVHVSDRPAYFAALSEATSLRENRSTEFRVRRDVNTGQTGVNFVWVEMRCRLVEQAGRDGDGREVVAVMRDITERKAHERMLHEARAEAERANAAKGRFLATMSHELRTPLNAIIGFSDMLAEESALGLDASRRRDYAHLIHESGCHLLSVVNSILDMSKIESGHFAITPERFAPRRVIDDCCALLSHRARECGIDLITELAGDLADVVADKRALHQIMLNLLSNAIKFSNRGGKVAVSARCEAGSLVVTVADTGLGIDKDDLPRVGNPFFQARSTYDRRHEGTGLGLSIVKGLLALHGGELQIASQLGEGTIASIRLPLDCGTGAHETGNVRPFVLQPAEELSDMRVKKSA